VTVTTVTVCAHLRAKHVGEDNGGEGVDDHEENEDPHKMFHVMLAGDPPRQFAAALYWGSVLVRVYFLYHGMLPFCSVYS
jgi:hypothetical protein